eukprot:4410330-Amphidinium_carterae.1
MSTPSSGRNIKKLLNSSWLGGKREHLWLKAWKSVPEAFNNAEGVIHILQDIGMFGGSQPQPIRVTTTQQRHMRTRAPW